MKNLANCKPTEFLKQTNRIRKVAEEWLDLTGILDIRKNKPVFPEGATEEEKLELAKKQVKKNLSDMLTKILDEYPEGTLKLLALLCFIEPEDADNHEVCEYLDSFAELISNESVLRFFVSLMRLGQTNI